MSSSPQTVNQAPSARTHVGTIPIGYIYALIAILSGSIAAVLAKRGISASIGPIPLLSVRLVIGAALLWLAQWFVFRQRPQIDRQLLFGAIAAGVANSISLSCFYLALLTINASVAMFVFSAHPLIVMGLLAVLGQALTQRDIVRSLIALVGVGLLVGVGGQVAWQGVALVMVTNVLYSIHLVIVQRYLKPYAPAQVTPILITVMAVCVTAVYLLTSPPLEWLVFPPDGWIIILLTAVFSTAVARLALIAEIQHLGSGQTALFGPVETLLSVAWAVIFLGEQLTPIQILGGTLVLFSAILIVRFRPRLPSDPSAT